MNRTQHVLTRRASIAQQRMIDFVNSSLPSSTTDQTKMKKRFSRLKTSFFHHSGLQKQSGEVMIILCLCFFLFNTIGLWFLVHQQSSTTAFRDFFRPFAAQSAQSPNNLNNLDESILFAFTIQDVSPVTRPAWQDSYEQGIAEMGIKNDDGLHIYHYNKPQYPGISEETTLLYLNNRFVAESPCKLDNKNNPKCYPQQMLQVFRHALTKSTADYFFYMESPSVFHLCVPLTEIQELALRQRRYFIATGTGSSGWLMRRDFVVDFIAEYDSQNKYILPDVVASNMLEKSHGLAVTIKYLVARSMPAVLFQDWPGCLQSRQGNKQDDGAMILGRDSFDYEDCPDSEVYPCHDNTDVTRKKHERVRPAKKAASFGTRIDMEKASKWQHDHPPNRDI